MTSNSATNPSSIKSPSPSKSPTKAKTWWKNPFQRHEKATAGSKAAAGAPSKPSSKPGKRFWLGGRKDVMEELRAEQKELVKALEALNQRLESGSTETPAGIDPMPVVRSIQTIESNQESLTKGLADIASQMERSEKSNQSLLSSISNVDQTLSGVQSSQAKTATAITQVGDKISEVTGRFETLFGKMQAAEEKMAADYRKFQQRTLVAIGSIAISAIVTVAIVLALPFG